MVLCAIGGKKCISGGNGLATGVVDLNRLEEILAKVGELGFGHVPEDVQREIFLDTTMLRETYHSMFGPTTGDRVRLGDTELWIEVEHDMVSRTPWGYDLLISHLARLSTEMRLNLAEASLVFSLPTRTRVSDRKQKAKQFVRVWVKLPINRQKKPLISLLRMP